MRVEEALQRYEVQLLGDGRSEHTIKQARRHVRAFMRWLGEREIEAVTHEDVARFLASDAVRLTADGGVRKASSANALRGSLRSFLRFVHEAGYAASNSGRLIRRARTRPPAPKALSDANVAKLVEALNEACTPIEKRDRALFTLMLRTRQKTARRRGARALPA